MKVSMLIAVVSTSVSLVQSADSSDQLKRSHPSYPAFETRLVDRAASAKFFEEQRKLQMVKLDSTAALNLLIGRLAHTSTESARKTLLSGIVKGLEGRRAVPKPEGWDLAKEAILPTADDQVAELVFRLDQLFGDVSATQNALVKIRDRNSPIAERRLLLAGLVTQQNRSLTEVLPSLLDDPGLRIPAIRAFGSIHVEQAPEEILSRYQNWGSESRRAAIETLAMRRDYAEHLLGALSSEQIPREDIPVHVARSLADLLGNSFTDVFGDIVELSTDKADLMDRYRRLLTAEKLERADPAHGRLVFAAACAACHQLYGEGGKLGPDLTGSNRADLSYILLNMIDPSADIPETYQLVTLHTRDGQILGGTIKQEDDQRIVLNLVGQTQTVLKTDIEKRETSPRSMMPEGILPALQDQQVLDLVQYLRSTSQVDLPK